MLDKIITPINALFYGVLSKVPVVGGLFGHTINAPANVKAFLMVIRSRESSLNDKAYNMVYGGGSFSNMSNHPYLTGEWKGIRDSTGLHTPAGAYQATYQTWQDFIKECGLHDFSKQSQDAFAVWLLKKTGAYDYLLTGNVREALRVASVRWSSLPDSDARQPKQTLDKALETYKKYGGKTF